MRTESDKRTVYKTDCSDSISLKKAYKEGKEINYTTSEDYVKGYNTSIDGMNITNTYVPVITTVKNDTTQHKLSKILTGDNTNIGLYLGICVLAIIGLYLLKKQKA